MALWKNGSITYSLLLARWLDFPLKLTGSECKDLTEVNTQMTTASLATWGNARSGDATAETWIIHMKQVAFDTPPSQGKYYWP